LKTPGLLQYTPIDPNEVAAIAHLGLENVGSTEVSSLHSNAKYTRGFGAETLVAEFDNTYFVNYDVRITPQSEQTSFVGGAYRPVRLRSKLNIGLTRADVWTVNGRLNYTGSYHNGNDPACPATPGCPVSRWLTLDWAVTYSSEAGDGSLLHGTRWILSVMNVLNSSPPYLYGGGRGLNYDPANANPSGRTLMFKVAKLWGHG